MYLHTAYKVKYVMLFNAILFLLHMFTDNYTAAFRRCVDGHLSLAATTIITSCNYVRS